MRTLAFPLNGMRVTLLREMALSGRVLHLIHVPKDHSQCFLENTF